MKMNLNEMKTLYTFGCPNREATVERCGGQTCPDTDNGVNYRCCG